MHHYASHWIVIYCCDWAWTQGYRCLPYLDPPAVEVPEFRRHLCYSPADRRQKVNGLSWDQADNSPARSAGKSTKESWSSFSLFIIIMLLFEPVGNWKKKALWHKIILRSGRGGWDCREMKRGISIDTLCCVHLACGTAGTIKCSLCGFLMRC